MNAPARSCASAHEHLRAATSGEHQAAEAALDLAGPLTVDVHRWLLGLFLVVLTPVEDVLCLWQLSHPGGWRAQRRSSLAAADLRQLAGAADVEAPPPWPVRPPPHGVGGLPEALGYAYALEGSRLGAMLIGERIARDRPAAPVSFFETAERGRWLAFLSVLEGTLVEEPARERAADAARSVFAELVSQAGRGRRA